MRFPGKNHNEQIIEQILLEEYNHYYRLAYSYVHREADAADIVQDGAYKAILHSGSLREDEHARTWVYRIMLNEIFRHLKRDTFIARGAFPLEAAAEAGTEDRYEDIDLRRALEAMSPEDKAVIELKYFEDMTNEQMAAVLKKSRRQIENLVYQSKRALRSELDKEGYCYEGLQRNGG